MGQTSGLARGACHGRASDRRRHDRAVAAAARLGAHGLRHGTGRTPEPLAAANTVCPEQAVTAGDVETHLNTVLRWGWGVCGPVRCEGTGPVGAGSAITGTRLPDSTDAAAPGPRDTALVVVLDEAGRYSFTAASPGLNAVPGDYLPGTVDCAVLAAPPVVASAGGGARVLAAADAAGPGRSNGLHATALLDHWITLSSPRSMDGDGDGRPCAESYPAEVIDWILASPLSPTSCGPVCAGADLADVRLHAEAVLSGTLYPCSSTTAPPTAQQRPVPP